MLLRNAICPRRDMRNAIVPRDITAFGACDMSLRDAICPRRLKHLKTHLRQQVPP